MTTRDMCYGRVLGQQIGAPPKPKSTPSAFKATAIKVGLYVAEVIAKIVDFATNIVPPIGLSKLYNYCYNKPLNDEINQAMLDSYQKALTDRFGDLKKIPKKIEIQTLDLKIINEHPTNDDKLSHAEKIKFNEEVKKFNIEFNKILEKVRLCKIYENGISAEDIRNDINDIVQTKVYQTYKFTNNQPCIEILQHLAYAGTTADAKTAIDNYGKKVRGDSAGTKQTVRELSQSLHDLADDTDALCFNRNDGLSGLWWAITHPQTFVHAGVSKLDPLAFEADKGNIPFRAGSIKAPGIDDPILLTFGPTPTDAAYFEAVLPYLQKNSLTEVRIMLTSQTGGEGFRGEEFDKKTKDFQKDGTLVLITLPFDMQPMKDPKKFMQKNGLDTNFSVEGFMTAYAEFITSKCREETYQRGNTADDIIPIIPKHILGDDDLKDCFALTKKTFNDIIPESKQEKTNKSVNSMVSASDNRFISDFEFFTPLFPTSEQEKLTEQERIELATSMQLFAQSVMVVKALSKINENCKKNERKIANLSIACKQCVDRAVALISAIVFLNEAPPTEKSNLNFELPETTCDFIHGIVVGRAQIVDQRLIMDHRLKVLTDFLDIISGKLSASRTDSNNLSEI